MSNTLQRSFMYDGIIEELRGADLRRRSAALLADREALVRYVRALEEHWGEATFPVGYTRRVGKLRNALSQELKDEISKVVSE